MQTAEEQSQIVKTDRVVSNTVMVEQCSLFAKEAFWNKIDLGENFKAFFNNWHGFQNKDKNFKQEIQALYAKYNANLTKAKTTAEKNEILQRSLLCVVPILQELCKYVIPGSTIISYTVECYKYLFAQMNAFILQGIQAFSTEDVKEDTTKKTAAGCPELPETTKDLLFKNTLLLECGSLYFYLLFHKAKYEMLSGQINFGKDLSVSFSDDFQQVYHMNERIQSFSKVFRTLLTQNPSDKTVINAEKEKFLGEFKPVIKFIEPKIQQLEDTITEEAFYNFVEINKKLLLFCNRFFDCLNAMSRFNTNPSRDDLRLEIPIFSLPIILMVPQELTEFETLKLGILAKMKMQSTINSSVSPPIGVTDKPKGIEEELKEILDKVCEKFNTLESAITQQSLSKDELLKHLKTVDELTATMATFNQKIWEEMKQLMPVGVAKKSKGKNKTEGVETKKDEILARFREQKKKGETVIGKLNQLKVKFNSSLKGLQQEVSVEKKKNKKKNGKEKQKRTNQETPEPAEKIEVNGLQEMDVSNEPTTGAQENADNARADQTDKPEIDEDTARHSEQPENKIDTSTASGPQPPSKPPILTGWVTLAASLPKLGDLSAVNRPQVFISGGTAGVKKKTI